MKIHTLAAISDPQDPFTFVASTGTVDRMGDVIEQDGWVLNEFKQNPIALWMHDHKSPIGVWENIKVESGRLVARLKLAARGTSALIDSLHALVEQRVLRAVSVGFMPEKYEDLKDKDGNPTGGYRFLKQKLLEISLVTVPANQEALALARSKGIPEDVLCRVFSPPDQKTRKDLAAAGPNARSLSSTATKTRTNTMPTLAERIAKREADLLSLRDQLTELTLVEEPTDEQNVQTEDLTSQIEAGEKALLTLQNAQKALAARSAPAGETQKTQDPAAPPTIKSRGSRKPGDLMVRASIVAIRSFMERRSVDDIIRSSYGGASDLEAFAKAVTDPAMTTVVGWAAELVDNTVGEFLDVLRPESIFFRAPLDRFTFGRGNLKLPGRNDKGLAGDFVGEGLPIPVRRTTMTSITLLPHKLGVITTLTRELAMLSDPAAEPLLRNLMIADTRETVDAKFLDNGAESAIRPGGMQSYATGGNTRVSSGTTLANVITDLKAAIAGMTAANMGRRPFWVMNTQHALSLQLMTNAAGAFMFRDELAQGNLLGMPIYWSTSVPTGVVFMMDGAEIASAFDTAPAIDVSEQATLHMADPADPIADAGGAADPVRSLFQTASIGLRLLWDMTWKPRRTGSVQTITGVAW